MPIQAYKEKEIHLWDRELLKSWGVMRVEFSSVHDGVDVQFFEEACGEGDFAERLPEDIMPDFAMMVGEERIADAGADAAEENDHKSKMPGSWE